MSLRTEVGPSGEEDVLHEYLCDWPDCPNVAVYVVGVVKELGIVSVVCEGHAPKFTWRAADDVAEAEM